MKHTLVTSIIWLLLIVIVSELTNVIYNDVYFPYVDPANSSYVFSYKLHSLLLLIFIIPFAIVGAMMSWQMNGTETSISAAMSIGVVYLAIGATAQFPWFIPLVSHPSTYDSFLSFIGTLAPPISASMGAVVYRNFRKPNKSLNQTGANNAPPG